MYRTKCLIPSDEAFDSFGRGVYHYTKTTCFGVKSMALYGDRKAFYDTKTTCFEVVEVAAYRSCLTRLSLKGRLLTSIHYSITALLISATMLPIIITTLVIAISCIIIITTSSVVALNEK